MALIAAFGCKNQPVPTSVSESSIITQGNDQVRGSSDALLLCEEVGIKSQEIQTKLVELQRKRPVFNNQESLAKATGVFKVPGDFNSIQEAVDAAGEGTVINVTGSFNERVWIDRTGNITINGGGAATVTDQAPFIIYGMDNVTIKGFNIDGLVYVGHSHGSIIKDNDISGPNDGISLYMSSGCTILGNRVHDKVPGYFGSGDGIYAEDSDNNRIMENQILANDKYGMGLVASNRNTLQNNFLANNQGGIYVINAGENSVKDSRIVNNLYAGIWLIESAENEIKDCEFIQNDFGIRFNNSSDNLIKDVVCNENMRGGIDFFEACFNNTIVGAVVNNNGTWEGMYFGSETANNTIKDSEAYGNELCDVQDDGTDNIFKNNQFGSFNCSLY
jgi:parallel beta-helix repeat protein